MGGITNVKSLYITAIFLISNNKLFLRILLSIPLEHTPVDPQPRVSEGVPFIWGFGDAWGMLQGYVGGSLRLLSTATTMGGITNVKSLI